MINFFLKAARYSKRVGESAERIRQLQQTADQTEWDVKDFTQFGQLLPLSQFKSEYDTSIYSFDSKCKDIMLYPQMYYIQLLDNGRWSYDGLFRKTPFQSPRLEEVESYVYSQIQKLEKSST